MQKIIVKAETTYEMTWPHKCSGCGNDVAENSIGQCEIKIKKGISAQFSKSKPKKIKMNLCDKCMKKLSTGNVMENIGGAFVLLAFIGPIFLGLNSPKQMYGAGATFWFGGFMAWLGGRKKKKTIGARCVRLSKAKWAFWFRNPIFYDAFVELNSAIMEIKKPSKN